MFGRLIIDQPVGEPLPTAGHGKVGLALNNATELGWALVLVFYAGRWIDDASRQYTTAINDAAKAALVRGNGITGIGRPVSTAVADLDVAHWNSERASSRGSDTIVGEQRGLASGEGDRTKQQSGGGSFHFFHCFLKFGHRG